MKKVLALIVIFYTQNSAGQKIGVDWFVRLPHVVNYNFTENSTFYTPMTSTGITFHYRSVFADVGAFIDKNDVYGYYTYFGSTIHSKQFDDHWKLAFHWFGEVTSFPLQLETKDLWIYTAGASPGLVRTFTWGSFAPVLTLGAAFRERTVSLNTRLILNCSITIRSNN